MAGKLILCATPIGNLGDITPRVLEALRSADRIAAEDTRNSRKLLTHFDIHTPMISYHENNRFDRGRELVDKMLAGETIALITDAGTPGISDPGEELVAMAAEAGIAVTSLPGAAACITALTLSGLPTRRFVMEGFLPRDKKERAEVLEDLRKETRTIILYEAPHRLKKTLAELADVLGTERRADQDPRDNPAGNDRGCAVPVRGAQCRIDNSSGSARNDGRNRSRIRYSGKKQSGIRNADRNGRAAR